jgi:hypothetical protein
VEEKFSSYLNEGQQFDCVVSCENFPVEGSGNHERNWNPEFQHKLRLVAEIFK